MATKWKNTAIPKIQKFLKNGNFFILTGILFGVIAFTFFFAIWRERYNFNTLENWKMALAADIFLLLACVLELKTYLNRTFKKKAQSLSYTYQSWRQDFHRQQKILLPLFALLFLAAVALWLELIRSTYRMDYNAWITLPNYSSGYILVFSVLIAFLSCECTLILFMKKLLDHVMEKTEEANKKIIDEAVAAEKKSIESAIKSEQLKVDLISNVSHDLKTPLTSMVGYIDLMKKEEMNDVMADYVEVLSNKAQKLKEMIESLFSLAKTSSGNIELNPEPLNLNRLIEQIYADMEDRITASGLTFVTELTAADTELVTDSSYLYRVCQNLVENALKYSAANTRVFLKTLSSPSVEGRIIRFEITNTAGYPMNFTKEQIVERFARGDASRTSEGNGLGLAIANTYTSALGGRFDVLIDCDQFKAIVEFTSPGSASRPPE